MDAFTLAGILTLDSSRFESGLASGERKFKSTGSSIIGAAKKIAKAVAAAKIAKEIINFGKESVQAGMKFDKAMAQVAATLGTTTDSIANLRDFAREMGAKTAFTATEAAEALNYMALAGYDAQKSMKMLPTVLNLAAAGNIDLAAASDMVTDAQSALGLTLDQTTAMVDQMAKTSSKTNTSVSQLGDAILTVGGTAKMLRGGTKELNAVLGVLADNGIKGAEGGTKLRNVILSLSAPTSKASKQLKKLGVDVYDASGKMRSMPDIFNDLNKALGKLSAKEKVNALNEIFNKTDLKAVNALLGTNVSRWEELYDAIDNAQGAAEEMAGTQLDNLAGDITKFNSAMGEAQLIISDKLTPKLREFVQFGTESVSRLTEAFKEGGLSGALQEAGKIIGEVGEKIKKSFEDVANKIAEIDWIQVGKNILSKIEEAFVDVADWYKTAYESAAKAIGEIDWKNVGKTIWEAISSAFGSITAWFKDTFLGGKDAAEKDVDWAGLGGAIKDYVQTGMSAIKDIIFGFFESAWQSIKEIDWAEVGLQIVNKNIEMIKGIVPRITQVFNDAASSIKEIDWVDVGKAIRETIQGAFESIKDWFNNLFSGVIFDTVELDWTGLGNSIVDLIKAGLEAIDGLLTGLFGDEWTQVKADAEAAWGTISSAFSDAFNAIKEKWDSIASLFTLDIPGAWKTVETTATEAWNKIKSTVDSVVSSIKSTVQGFIDTINNAISTVKQWLGFDGKSVTTTSNHVNNVYTVQHFVSEKGVKHSGKEGTFAKGMFGGQILQGATIFGVDRNGRPLEGGGEGPEAVVGVGSLREQIKQAVRDGFSGIANGIAATVTGGNQPIYVVLDTGELVGAIGPKIDSELGSYGDWKGGGRA